MMKTRFYIPTRGRANRQRTIHNLPEGILCRTYLVCDEDEYKEHVKECSGIIPKKRILAFPPKIGNFIVGKFGCAWDKKQWIFENTSADNMFFMDDDLAFDIRKDGKLLKASKRKVYDAFNIMTKWIFFEKIAHVCLGPREGNNRVVEDYIDNSRAMRVMGYDVEVIRKHKLKFNRLQLMSDFEMTLTLLELGYSNRVLYKYANGQRKSNDDGGCSIYRTPELMERAAKGLKKLHPNFVKVKKVETSQPWAGFDTNIRYDVQVSWKKAYQYGVGKKRSKTNMNKLFSKRGKE